MNKASVFILFCVLMAFLGCEESVLPKPKAMLRLEYSRPIMADAEMENFKFNYNQSAEVKKQNSASLRLEYPEMKAAIFISYKKVSDNLQQLITDAERLSYEHAVKADDIRARVYENSDEGVYGTFFEVVGDAASQAQFYVTDSTAHFVTGSLYFAVKPNYDSIYPAAAYLQQDIGHIMETLRWK
ncbi:gliding motility lipoprotein GldD [Maribacter sp. 2307UL18-2]|uniref:gliding motility lipoprotein GldD n=1 Tax=Maribacter sp. 2307UL18-2 TaxID=3386274 RepID=UPI0039BD532E